MHHCCGDAKLPLLTCLLLCVDSDELNNALLVYRLDDVITKVLKV